MGVERRRQRRGYLGGDGGAPGGDGHRRRPLEASEEGLGLAGHCGGGSEQGERGGEGSRKGHGGLIGTSPAAGDGRHLLRRRVGAAVEFSGEGYGVVWTKRGVYSKVGVHMRFGSVRLGSARVGSACVPPCKGGNRVGAVSMDVRVRTSVHIYGHILKIHSCRLQICFHTQTMSAKENKPLGPKVQNLAHRPRFYFQFIISPILLTCCSYNSIDMVLG